MGGWFHLRDLEQLSPGLWFVQLLFGLMDVQFESLEKYKKKSRPVEYLNILYLVMLIQ